MSKRTIIPFGPQHPVLPEPIQLRLVMEEERVVEALPAIGYIHRGLEKLVEKKDFNQCVFLAERVCGICSFLHSVTYSQGIEEMMSVAVPDRAKFLRLIWGEIHRVHSHLLWLGLLADSFGFENVFMHAWRCREKVLDLMEKTAGHRVMLGTCCVGGVRRDITDEGLAEVLRVVDELQKEFDEFVPVVLNDYSIKQRTIGVGKLTKEQAAELGAVGPVARASGIARDFRETGYAAYGQVGFKIVTATSGDCYARIQVRCGEMYECLEMIRRAVKALPAGAINVAVKGNPSGEVVSRVEQPRGEVVYYLKGNGTKNLERMRIRTPTFANLAPLLAMLPGCELADVPVIVLSIDPCISCTER